MENQVSSKSVILNYGLTYGIILVLTSVVLYAMNVHLSTTGGLIGLGVLAVMIILMPILGMLKFRKENLNIMSWGQSLKIGMGIIIFGTLINIIYGFIFSGFIEPEYNNQVLELQKTALEESTRLTSEQIEQQMEVRALFQGTLLGGAVGLLFFAFVGFVVSAIAGAIMKRSEEDGY